MNREDALDVLELASGASAEQIEKRYELLVRRYRQAEDQTAREKLTQINAAYAVLNPRPVSDVFQDSANQRLVMGKTWAYWKNWLYYTKWFLLAAVAGIIIVVYLIVTMVTNRPADFKVILIGDYGFVSDDANQEDIFASFETSIVEALQPLDPEIKKASLDWITLRFNSDGSLDEANDRQFQQANLMKAMAQLSTEDFDVVLLSRGAYVNYANQTDFIDLTALLDQLAGQLPVDRFEQIQSLTAHPAESALVYPTGLDATALDLLKDVSLTGDSLIVTIGPRCKKPELAQTWISSWMANQ